MAECLISCKYKLIQLSSISYKYKTIYHWSEILHCYVIHYDIYNITNKKIAECLINCKYEQKILNFSKNVNMILEEMHSCQNIDK